MVEVPFKLLQHDAKVPTYATSGAAGCDAYAYLPDQGYVNIQAGARLLIGTGISAEIPPGYELQVRPRSGLALKNGVTVLNSPGTIDSDYRGEIGVILINHGQTLFQVRHGDRIAQFVLAKVEQAEWTPKSELVDTARGAGGFGSTGVKS